MRDTHVQEFVTMRHPKQGNLAFTTKTASQQRLNVHTCNYPGLEFISKGKISSVKENNQPRTVLNFCLRPPFFQFPLENVCSQGGRQDEYAHAQWSDPLPISSEIALQVVRTSFRFHLRECMGSSFPPCFQRF